METLISLGKILPRMASSGPPCLQTQLALHQVSQEGEAQEAAGNERCPRPQRTLPRGSRWTGPRPVSERQWGQIQGTMTCSSQPWAG